MSYALRPHVHGLGCGCSMRSNRSSLGELVTPSRLAWLPGEVRAWLNQINGQITSLDRDIIPRRAALRANAVGTRFLADWDELRNQWLAFNHTASTWWAQGSISPAQEYVNRYNLLEDRYRALTGSSPTQYARLSEDEQPNLVRSANYTLMAWAVIGIAGAVSAGYLLNNYARIKTLSKLTFNRRRRLR